MNILIESEYECYIVYDNCMISSSYMINYMAGHFKNLNVGLVLICIFKNFSDKA